MSWRIVYITDVDKLSLNLNSVQINNKIIYKNKNFTILNSIPQYINDVISFISIGKNELDIPYLIDE